MHLCLYIIPLSCAHTWPLTPFVADGTRCVVSLSRGVPPRQPPPCASIHQQSCPWTRGSRQGEGRAIQGVSVTATPGLRGTLERGSRACFVQSERQREGRVTSVWLLPRNAGCLRWQRVSPLCWELFVSAKRLACALHLQMSYLRIQTNSGYFGCISDNERASKNFKYAPHRTATEMFFRAAVSPYFLISFHYK